MLKAYRYELNLNNRQKAFMNKSFGCARVAYNYCLDRRVKLYETEKKRISAYDLCKEVVMLKRNENYSWLNEIDHQTLNCSVQNLDSAFTRFFKQKKGFPKFKSKHNLNQSCQFTQGIKLDFEKHKIRFPKIGWCNFYMSRIFEGQHKTVTVRRNSVGRYFVSILVDNGKELPKPKVIKEKTAIGIDVGIKTFATLSNGEKFDNPKYLESAQKRLSILQRRLSKKVKGGNRRKLARLAVAKCQYKISNQRKDFLHKLSSKIVSENQTIITEDLNIAGMLQNHKLARSISSASWSEFIDQLKYKSEWYGKNFVTIGRFEPSSKMCHSCGAINKTLTLKDREWVCASCGTLHDRDVTAAINIKKFGLQKQNLTGQGLPKEDVETLAMVKSEKRQVTGRKLP